MKLTKLLLTIFILSLPLGQLGRLPFGTEGLNLYIYDVLLATILFAWFIYAFGIRKKVFIPPLSGLIAAFAAISLLSLLNAFRWLNLDEFVVSGSYWIRWVMYAGLYFVVYDLIYTDGHSGKRSASRIRNIPRFWTSQNDGNWIVNLLVLSGITLAILGFLQLIFFPDFKQLAETGGWDPHKNRLASTFLDPNFCGAYLVLSLTIIISKTLCSRHPEFISGSGRSRTEKMLKRVQHDRAALWYVIALVIISIALLLTFSRSAWLMFTVSIFVIGILKSKKLLIVAFIIAFCAYYFVPRVQTRIANITDPADSASKRLISWQRTWDIAKENLITGAGFNAFRYAQKEQGYFEAGELGGRAGAGSDSSLLLVLATTGVLGFIAYLALYGRIATDAFLQLRHSELASESEHIVSSEILKRVQDDNESKTLSLALLACLAGLLIESNFINSLFYPQIMAWIWILTALVYADLQSQIGFLQQKL